MHYIKDGEVFWKSANKSLNLCSGEEFTIALRIRFNRLMDPLRIGIGLDVIKAKGKAIPSEQEYAVDRKKSTMLFGGGDAAWRPTIPSSKTHNTIQ